MNRKRLLSHSDSDYQEEEEEQQQQQQIVKKVQTSQKKSSDLEVKEEDSENTPSIKQEEEEDEEDDEEDDDNDDEDDINEKLEENEDQQQQQNQQQQQMQKVKSFGKKQIKVSEKQKIKHRQFLLQKAQQEAEQNDNLFQEMLENSDDDEENESQSTTDKKQEQESQYISEEQQKLNRKIMGDLKKFIEIREAQVIRQPDYRTQKISNLTIFTIKCQKNHIWDSSFRILKNRWCPKCAVQFNKIRQYVQNLKGKLISQCLTSSIKVQCAKQHTFELNEKTYQDNWCQECFQQIMNRFQMPNTDEFSQHIKESAKTQAIEFIKKNSSNFTIESDFSKISSAIYVNDIPQDMYIRYLQGLNKEDLKRHKYTTQRNIHPDVNGHPCARSAFIKFTSIFEMLNKQ